MSEAEFCCDEGKYLADRYFREQERQCRQSVDVLNCSFIGIEKDTNYFNIAQKRILEAESHE